MVGGGGGGGGVGVIPCPAQEKKSKFPWRNSNQKKSNTRKITIGERSCGPLPSRVAKRDGPTDPEKEKNDNDFPPTPGGAKTRKSGKSEIKKMRRVPKKFCAPFRRISAASRAGHQKDNSCPTLNRKLGEES